MRGSAGLALAALVLAMACGLGGPSVLEMQFACASDLECASGYRCEDGVCAAAGDSADAAEPPDQVDGGKPDAGSLPACEEGAPCAGGAAFRCCQGRCVDLSADSTHCGGCGIGCKAGNVCHRVSEGEVLTGRCGCGTTSHCLRKGAMGLSVDQLCSGGMCSCSGEGACVPGMSCQSSADPTVPPFCL